MHRCSIQEGSKRVLHLATRHALVLVVLIASVTGTITVATFAANVSCPAKSDTIYRVLPGDTLSGIAAAHHTTVEQLALYNAIPNPNLIFPLQVVCIPSELVMGLPIVPQNPSHAAGLSSSPTPTQRQNPDFVKVCGTQLCLNGQVWQLHGGSANGATPDANARMDMAVQGHLNTVRLTDYLHRDAYDENQWKAVDGMIAAAHTHGVHILLDLSTYGGVVARKTSGSTHFFAYDWNPFLTFVLNRTNTITGMQYKNDPTIAVIGLLGEIGPGNNPQDVISFFKRTAAEFKAIDHNHVLEPGGLYQMWQGSGIDYQTIFAIPQLDICAVHAPALIGVTGNDATTTAQTCQALGKPWIWEEFSQPQGIGDQNRANWFQNVYDNAQKYKAAGASFWNLGPGVGDSNDDVGPQTPITWATVIKNAPPQLSLTPTPTQPLTSTTPLPLPGTVSASSLTLTTTAVSLGQTLTAQITYKNQSTTPVSIQAIGINGIAPGGTRTQGPWVNFVPGQGALTLQPGQSTTLTTSHTFTRSDSPGTWFAYATYRNSTGTWIDDTNTVPFTVTDSNR